MIGCFTLSLTKTVNSTSAKMGGFVGIEKATGCKRPCNYYRYKASGIMSYPKANHNNGCDELGLLKASGSNSSSFVTLIYYPPLKYRVTLEQPVYTAICFISEVGGILGIFGGISFWSVYKLTISPLITKLKQQLSAGRSFFT